MKSQKVDQAFALDDVIIQGLFYCPYGKENYSCFFKWLQKKDTADKISWFHSLNNRDKQDLMYCHLKCTCKNVMDVKKVKLFQNN